MDGCARGYHQQLLGPFRRHAKAIRHLVLISSEDSLLERRAVVKEKSSARGFMTLRQMETALMITAECEVTSTATQLIGKRPNKHFDGSTTGEVLGPINAPDFKDVLQCRPE